MIVIQYFVNDIRSVAWYFGLIFADVLQIKTQNRYV
ncbi:hypothetical protein SAMN05421857_3898 [Chryseobacterium formosense]|nr:hypothetical protein SAMN05421857_3898 [Chryseobacterium formosense]